MSNKDKRIARIWKEIDEILWNDWDPIGVKVFEETARDEYQDYIYGIFRLLENGTTIKELAKHLADIETSKMGMNTHYEKLLPIAKKLMQINLSKEK